MGSRDYFTDELSDSEKEQTGRSRSQSVVDESDREQGSDDVGSEDGAGALESARSRSGSESVGGHNVAEETEPIENEEEEEQLSQEPIEEEEESDEEDVEENHEVDPKEDQKPFKCSVCGRGFTRPHHLEDHLLIHSGLLKHVCLIDRCCTGFRLKSQYTSHAKRHGFFDRGNTSLNVIYSFVVNEIIVVFSPEAAVCG